MHASVDGIDGSTGRWDRHYLRVEDGSKIAAKLLRSSDFFLPGQWTKTEMGDSSVCTGQYML